MEDGQHAESWQKKLKVRGFRLMGWALPLMLASLFASSLLSRSLPTTLVDRDWGTASYLKGRMETPQRGGDELPVLVEISGPLPLPKAQTITLRFKSVDGSLDFKRQWKITPKEQKGEWTAGIVTAAPAGRTTAYLIRWTGKVPPDLHLKLVSDPERFYNKYLRMAEIAFFPMLAFCLLAAVMIIFPQLSK